MIASPTPARLLSVWEQGSARSPVERSWLLLRAAEPDADEAQLAGLCVGEADRRLLALRDAAFGSRFDAVSRCPRCAESIELDFRSEDFPHIAGSADPTPRQLNVAGFTVEFVSPTVRDLIGVAQAASFEIASRQLVESCLVSATDETGSSIVPASLPYEVIATVGSALEEADPLSCTRLELQCPACAHQWSSVFDVASYLWAELDAWAKGLLGEVHVLARAYGWTEPEVLALSTRRRQHYLDLVLA